ncbi:rCG35634 [Rattus norvegicus]|uniref:RCG35634 n=1 Tax=Rattus norvegicus TaxID=10116 RepID=A6KF86_RAT|nr:rCG35634 [Rattus norvegicus]
MSNSQPLQHHACLDADMFPAMTIMDRKPQNQDSDTETTTHRTCYAAQGNLEILILLPASPSARIIGTCSVPGLCSARIEHRVLCAPDTINN